MRLPGSLVSAVVAGGALQKISLHGTAWILPKLADLARKWRPDQLVIDPGSPAGALLRDLEDARIKPHLTSTREVAQACGAFYDAVMDGSVKVRRHPDLDAAVAGAAKQPTGDAWRWGRKASKKADISLLMAATCGLWAFASKSKPRVVSMADAMAQLEAEESDG